MLILQQLSNCYVLVLASQCVLPFFIIAHVEQFHSLISCIILIVCILFLVCDAEFNALKLIDCYRFFNRDWAALWPQSDWQDQKFPFAGTMTRVQTWATYTAGSRWPIKEYGDKYGTDRKLLYTESDHSCIKVNIVFSELECPSRSSCLSYHLLLDPFNRKY